MRVAAVLKPELVKRGEQMELLGAGEAERLVHSSA